MLSWFKKKKKETLPAPGYPTFKFQSIDVEEVAQYNDGVQSILEGERTGFEIRNFLNQEEVKSLVQNAWAVPDKVQVMGGLATYPMSFAQTQQAFDAGELTLPEYHQMAKDFQRNFPDRFGVDVEARLQEVVKKMSGDIDIVPPPTHDGQGAFLPFNYKYLSPGAGRLKVHCGLYFYDEFARLAPRYAHFTENKRQISFFIMLQPPENGGELTIYDLTWNQAKERPDDWHLKTLDGQILDIRDEQQLPQKKLRPQPGTLILFDGGHVWHQVETVTGERPRITLGGFMSFSHNFDKLQYWT